MVYANSLPSLPQLTSHRFKSYDNYGTKFRTKSGITESLIVSIRDNQGVIESGFFTVHSCKSIASSFFDGLAPCVGGAQRSH